jgi:hypothetical protein
MPITVLTVPEASLTYPNCFHVTQFGAAVHAAALHEGGTVMHRKHLWVLMCFLLLIPTLGCSE